jgi:Zn-dependent protease with chaperone function
VLALLVAWLALVLAGLAGAVLAAGRSLGAARRMRALSAPDERGFRALRSGEAHAFVLGFLRPRVYVSHGLLGRADPRSLEAVLAHERAHVRRREPLRRLAASVALALHLPGVSGAVARALRAAEEASADAEAARALGDGVRVAEALVRFARLRLAAPLAAGFEADALEARVREVLASPPRSERPGAGWLLAAAGAALATALAAAPLLHLATERLLELAAGT